MSFLVDLRGFVIRIKMILPLSDPVPVSTRILFLDSPINSLILGQQTLIKFHRRERIFTQFILQLGNWWQALRSLRFLGWYQGWLSLTLPAEVEGFHDVDAFLFGLELEEGHFLQHLWGYNYFSF